MPTPSKLHQPRGVVTRLHRLGCTVEGDGRVYECKRAKDADLCVGDEVLLRPTDDPERAFIEERLPRRSWFARGVPGGRQSKLVAANAHLLGIVVAVENPPLHPGLIDRFLVLAGVGRMDAFICVNKMDLAEPQAMDALLEPYALPGMAMLRMSAIKHEGVEPVRRLIRNKRTLFCGHSGVGKSTLLNAIIGDHERLRTGDISAATGKGVHTTTWVDWIALDERTVVIDTPGIRHLSLAMLEPRQIVAGFPEFAPFVAQCAFKDCLHHKVKGCAVEAAAQRGDVHPVRYERYCAILENP